MTSPNALTAAHACTIVPSQRVLAAVPSPPRIQPAAPSSLPTVQPVPTPTLPRAGPAPTSACSSAAAPAAASGAVDAPRTMSNTTAAGTIGTGPPGVASPTPRAARPSCTPGSP